MTKDEVIKLSKLARIYISDDEAESLVKDFDAILGYVGQVKKALENVPHMEKDKSAYPNRNTMRENDAYHDSGMFTEDLLNAAPKRDGQYVKVKKIL